MLKAALAGALALAAVGVMTASAQETGSVSPSARGGHSTGIALTEGQIAQAKAALRLTPAQERHWPRVAAALRSLGRQGASSEQEGPGLMERVRHRAAALSSQAAAARKVLAAASPLIRTLDAEQKQSAMMMVRSMGFGHLASRL